MPEVVHLTAEDLVLIAAPATGAPGVVRDYGLLDAAANRPRASAFGQDAYPSLHLKAAALLQSLLMNHPLVYGNKRLAWLATVVFYDLNGHALDALADEAFDFVLAVVTDHLDTIGAQLEKWATPR